MASYHRRTVLGGLAGSVGGGSAFAQAQDLSGTWNGVLQVGAGSLRLRLVVGEKVNLISLDQGATVIPASEATVAADALRANFPSVGGILDLRAADGALRGTWTQGGQAFPITFGRGEAPAPTPRVLPPLTEAGLRELRRTSGAPALAAAWAKASEPARLLAAGVRNTTSNTPVTPQDRWHLGSIGKSMTATLVALHVEQGVLSWDATVGEVLGELIPQMRQEHRGATLLELLSHRAGFDGNLPIAALQDFRDPSGDPIAERRRFVAQALALPAVGPRRETFLYSNNGFVTAAAMLEAKTGKPWEVLMRQELFAPLGLSSAGFGPPDPADQPVGHYVPPGTAGATPARTPVVPAPGAVADNVEPMGPAGRIHMSLADLLTYLKSHRDRTPMLKADSWAKLHTPPFGGTYALGWMVRPDGGLWHNGSNTIWYAEALVDRERDVVAAAVSNDAFQASQAAVSDALIQARSAALSHSS